MITALAAGRQPPTRLGLPTAGPLSPHDPVALAGQLAGAIG